jgi:hypothetical protein
MVTASQDKKASVGADLGVTSWDGASERSLEQALVLPAAECVEAEVIGRCRWRVSRRPSHRRLGLMVTARSAYRHPVARIFVGAMQKRLHLSQELRERVHIALQEAVMNAILHGNLGLDPGLRDSLQGLATLHDTIAARFASARIARSIIRVDARWTRTMLHLVIRDSGRGFKLNRLSSADEGPGTGRIGSGRGLIILGAMCDRIAFLRGGTTIELGFLLLATRA